MASGFAFSFGGDDIEGDKDEDISETPQRPSLVGNPPPTAGAFPVAGKPQLPANHHDLNHMLFQLPPKVAYSMLDIDGGAISLPRRELWDVKVQVMAEQDVDAELEPGLGTHDVKTGVYEGGFKSWESSVDLVKELQEIDPVRSCASSHRALRVVELGCGTALPSLALFQAVASSSEMRGSISLFLTLTDYNPTVLQLVTLPNFILAWGLVARHENPLVNQAFDGDGELELSSEVVNGFKNFLLSNSISLSFVSGGWSDEFVDILYDSDSILRRGSDDMTLFLGAETIYSPFALASFTKTLMSILLKERGRHIDGEAFAIIGAKRHYFGVGGSLDDFVDKARESGCSIDWLREEGQGIRRGVVRCHLV